METWHLCTFFSISFTLPLRLWGSSCKFVCDSSSSQWLNLNKGREHDHSTNPQSPVREPEPSKGANSEAWHFSCSPFSLKKISTYSWSANWYFFYPLKVFLGLFALQAHTRSGSVSLYRAKQALFLLLFLLFFIPSKNINYLIGIIIITLLSKQVSQYGLILQKWSGGARSFISSLKSLN